MSHANEIKPFAFSTSTKDEILDASKVEFQAFFELSIVYDQYLRSNIDLFYWHARKFDFEVNNVLTSQPSKQETYFPLIPLSIKITNRKCGPSACNELCWICLYSSHWEVDRYRKRCSTPTCQVELYRTSDSTIINIRNGYLRTYLQRNLRGSRRSPQRCRLRSFISECRHF